MPANYYGSLPNSSWLTHVATIGVTNTLNIRFLRVCALCLHSRDGIRRGVLRACTALCLIAWLRASVMAGPSDPELPPSDHDVAVTDGNSSSHSPWIDLAPTSVLHRN